MPFTAARFFDVLAAYNTALWPAVVALWVASVAVLIVAARHGVPQRALAILLTVHWAWSALAYHAAYFTRINPAAWLFAVLFLFEAGTLFWEGVMRDRLSFRIDHSARTLLGMAFVVYALAYPLIVLAEGLPYPRAPLFALPCPTTLFTIGWLLVAEMPGWRVTLVPLIWSVVGWSAASLFGVGADLALPLAGAALVIDRLLRPSLA